MDPEDEIYVASCPELGSLSAHGADPHEAVKELSEALRLAITTYDEEGWELPEARELRVSVASSGCASRISPCLVSREG